MKTIYKYSLTQGSNYIPMPEGAKILSVRVQDRIIQCWAAIDAERPMYNKHLYVVQTGEMIQHPLEKMRFIGTVEIDWWIGHVFEVIP
jgi:hypothetical protein